MSRWKFRSPDGVTGKGGCPRAPEQAAEGGACNTFSRYWRPARRVMARGFWCDDAGACIVDVEAQVSDDLAALAADAYVYGFPLVFDLQEVGGFTREGMGSLAPAPFNSFSHASKLAGPQDRFVSINNDTIYSIAQVDVSHGPVLLRVPDTAGRYYVLQFVDAWTNNFATWAAGRPVPPPGPTCWSRRDGRPMPLMGFR